MTMQLDLTPAGEGFVVAPIFVFDVAGDLHVQVVGRPLDGGGRCLADEYPCVFALSGCVADLGL